MSKVVLREGDTVYVQSPCLTGETECEVRFVPDWLELAQQKHRLVTMIWDKPDDILWGLVHLIDHIQDTAEENGRPVVYAYNADELEEIV